MTRVLLLRSLEESVTLPKEIKENELRTDSLNKSDSKGLLSNYF